MDIKNLQSKTRFKDAAFLNNIALVNVLIVGAGGVGSWTTLFLDRCGFSIEIVDFDTVSIENYAGQFYNKESLHKNKATAVVELCYSFCELSNVVEHPDAFRGMTYINNVNVVISAVDTVEARGDVFAFYKNLDTDNKLFIDARLSAEFFSLICIAKLYNQSLGISEQEYMNNLNNLNSLDNDVCTLRQTSHIAAMCASYITNIVCNFTALLDIDVDTYDILKHIYKIEDIHYSSSLLNLSTSGSAK